MVHTPNYIPPFHFVVVFKFTLILLCLRLYMHSSAHTGVHSLAASVQNSHVHINILAPEFYI